MNFIEKSYSIFAILFAFVLLGVLVAYPEMRQLSILLPVSLLGLFINIGLMFIVLRDIFFRQFSSATTKYVWIGLVLLFWPAILYYLPKYGFRKRD